MKSVLLIVLGCGLLCLIGGCVLPAAGHYYFPEASAGSAVSGYCKNSMGPKNTLRLMLGNAKLLLSADKTSESVVHVNMQITGDRVVIAQRAVNGMDVYVADGSSPLSKVNIKEVPLGIGYLYSFDINAAPNKFVVRLPAIQVEGKPYAGIMVTFTYKAGVWATVPNC